MRRIYFILFTMAIACTAGAQTILNAGMETWRSNSAGGSSGPSFTIQAPGSWYGFDSTIIEDGEMYGPLLGAGSNWHTQLFEEDTIVNSGSKSAKLMTVLQDTFGYVGCIMSNAQIGLDLAAIFAGGITNPLDALTFSGGTETTLRIMTVSAYVMLKGGIDTMTHMMGGNDTGLLAVQAVCTAYGPDSVIGNGFVQIPPGSSFTQVTANVIYNDTISSCDLVRIIFSSSSSLAISGTSLDSTTLYVDDVSMTGVPEMHVGVKNITAEKAMVKVYPNPASGAIYFDGPQNAGLSVKLISVSGQIAAIQKLKGNDMLPVENLAPGIYSYMITDSVGSIVQQGKVSVCK